MNYCVLLLMGAKGFSECCQGLVPKEEHGTLPWRCLVQCQRMPCNRMSHLKEFRAWDQVAWKCKDVARCVCCCWSLGTCYDMRIAYSNVLSQSWESALGTLAMLQLQGAEANLNLAANVDRRAVAPGHSWSHLWRPAAASLSILSHCMCWGYAAAPPQHPVPRVNSGSCWAEVMEHGGTCWNSAVVTVVGLSSTLESCSKC